MMSNDVTDQLAVLGEILDQLVEPVTIGELTKRATTSPEPVAPSTVSIDTAPAVSRRPRLALGIAASIALVIGGAALAVNRSSGVSTRAPLGSANTTLAGSTSTSAAESATTPQPAAASPNITADDVFAIVRSETVMSAHMTISIGTLMQTCMAEKGFRFTPTLPEGDGVTSDTVFFQRRYTSPREQAGRWGYIFDSSILPTPNEPIEKPSPDSNKPGFTEAITGDVIATSTVTDSSGRVANKNTVRDGCGGQAAAAIFGSAQNYLNFIDRISRVESAGGESWAALLSTPQNSGWVACMKQRGFDYANLVRPHDNEWPAPRPTDEESRIASADAACRVANHLSDNDLKMLEHDLLVAILERHPIKREVELDRMFAALVAGPVSPADVQLPFETAVYEGVGYSQKEIHDAYRRFQVAEMRSCLKASGHDLSDEQAQLFFPPDEVSRTLLDALIEAISVEPGGTAALPNIGESLAMDCRRSTELDVAYQLGELFNGATMEISNRLVASDGYRSAVNRQKTCMSTLGEPNGSGERESSILSQASKTLGDLQSGNISKADAAKVAAKLTAETEALRPTANCASSRLRVERQLVAAEQTLYLEGHPGVIDKIVEQYRAVLKPLAPFLPPK
jgi:hypothetical protein